MKMFRQIIAWMVLACLLTGGIPLPASKAAEPSAVVASGTIGNITWTITNFYHETQGYISRNVLDVMGTGAIPDYNSCSLAPWFSDYNGKYLTEINIGSGITRIGEFAFYPASMAYTNQIDMVEIPDTVTEIGKGAFSGQAHLEYVKVPNSVVSIDENAFNPTTTIICSAHSAAFQYGLHNNPMIVTDLKITLTLGPEGADEVTLSRGEEIAYQVSTNVEGVTPQMTARPAAALDIDTERQVLTASSDDFAPNGAVVTVTASAYGAAATCKVNILKRYTVHLWEGFYLDDLGEEYYNEDETYYPDYTLTRPGYVLQGWYTAEQVWSSGQGCFVFEFHRVTSVSGGDYDLFCFWDRDISEAEIASIPDQVYTGQALMPDVTVTLDGSALVKDRDYTLSYKNNIQAGEATVEVTGIGDYAGTVKSKFMIKPPETKITSLKNSAKKTVTVKWKKAGSGSGYQIQYGLKKNMKGAKTLTVKKLKTTSAKIKNLKKGKTYYVRIRVYKTVKNKKIYSKWSPVKQVKVTK